jgi:SAM-dependent methyltransferase
MTMVTSLLRRLGLSRSRAYQDIVPSYREYKDLQTGHFCSYESEVPKWEEGQRRFIDLHFGRLPRDSAILDIACGDGVGLRAFRAAGFTNVTGLEFNTLKAERARQSGYPVLCQDMHDLSGIATGGFDVVYSSHTIEHAYYPKRMIRELARVLRPGGRMFVVLPYPDPTTVNDQAHGAKYELGTNLDDDGRTVVAYFERCGLRTLAKTYDQFREPEIWLTFTR